MPVKGQILGSSEKKLIIGYQLSENLPFSESSILPFCEHVCRSSFPDWFVPPIGLTTFCNFIKSLNLTVGQWNLIPSLLKVFVLKFEICRQVCFVHWVPALFQICARMLSLLRLDLNSDCYNIRFNELASSTSCIGDRFAGKPAPPVFWCSRFKTCGYLARVVLGGSAFGCHECEF